MTFVSSTTFDIEEYISVNIAITITFNLNINHENIKQEWMVWVWGAVRFAYNGQYPLSVTKVIC